MIGRVAALLRVEIVQMRLIKFAPNARPIQERLLNYVSPDLFFWEMNK